MLTCRGGCARVIECNLSSSAHHRVCTFFQPFSTLPRRVDYDLADIAERQSPDRNKRPRGTPTFLAPVRPTKRVPLHEVAYQGEQLQPQMIIPPRQSLVAMPTQRMQLRALSCMHNLRAKVSDHHFKGIFYTNVNKVFLKIIRYTHQKISYFYYLLPVVVVLLLLLLFCFVLLFFNILCP